VDLCRSGALCSITVVCVGLEHCVALLWICVGVEHGQHDLYSDAGPSRGQRRMSGSQQGTDLFWRHGQHCQGMYSMSSLLICCHCCWLLLK